MQTVIKNRPNPHNVQERLAVENEDQATALVRLIMDAWERLKRLELLVEKNGTELCDYGNKR